MENKTFTQFMKNILTPSQKLKEQQKEKEQWKKFRYEINKARGR